MPQIRVGVQLHPQHTTYQAFAESVQAIEQAGVDTIWNWDHFYPLYGEADGNHFEGWTLLTAMAMLTTRVEIGCLVTCNSYRNPNLLADMARTVDHISGGRLIFGIGSGWFERDYNEYGFEFGTAPGRLQDLKQNLPIVKERWNKLVPPPIRNPIPLLIGGGGEKVTLRLTAQYADLWNGFGPPETFKHKNEVLDNWCREIGRNPSEIERTVTTNPGEEGQWDAFVEAGATHLILGLGAPFDITPVQQLVAWRNARS